MLATASARWSPRARDDGSVKAAPVALSAGVAVRAGVGVAGAAAATLEDWEGAAGAAGVDVVAWAGVAGAAGDASAAGAGAGAGLGSLAWTELVSFAFLVWYGNAYLVDHADYESLLLDLV
jgi:hypothetical protein